MTNSRRSFLKTAAMATPAVLAAPYVKAQNAKITWRLQTYAGAALAEFVVRPAVDAFNKAANGEMEIQLFTADTARDWMEWSGFALADVVNEDETPAAKLGAVGFVKAPKGAKSDFDFPYDEVCIVTKGRCRVRSMSGVVTAGPGEVIYLPAHLPGTFEALDDKVDLEDSVFLAGNDGPRRTAQIVIRQNAKQVSNVRWSFIRSTTSPAATSARRAARHEPELPL